ncbi:hypothetical protein N879_06990 [Alcaligenes sp. EGD-AK7]|nr:hypothetical protein N879_06990 [Alcaligenes sp. EGD-AK7]
MVWIKWPSLGIVAIHRLVAVALSHGLMRVARMAQRHQVAAFVVSRVAIVVVNIRGWRHTAQAFAIPAQRAFFQHAGA